MIRSAAEAVVLIAAYRRMKSHGHADLDWFGDLVGNANAILWEMALPSRRFVFVSPHAERVLGYPVSQWFDEDDFWTKHIHPDDRARATQLLADATAKGHEHEFEYRAVAADGRAVWLSDVVRVVKSRPGGDTVLRGVMTDVSARHAAQERTQQLAHEREEHARADMESNRFLQLIGSLDAIVWEANADTWQFTFVSGAAAEVLGIPPEQWLAGADSWPKAIHPEDRESWVEFKRQLAEDSGETREFQCRAVKTDGSTVWLRTTVRGRRDDHGHVTQYCGVMLDVTKRAEAERAREALLAERARLLDREREARTAAERALRIRDEVLGVVAHDLRNPVHTIDITAETMLALTDFDADRQRYVHIIRRAAHSMDRLIRDLLDVRRVEAGTFAIRKERVDIGALVEETLELFAPEARQRHIGITLDSLRDVPSVVGDRDRLRQVLSNLLGNALKFTRANGQIGVEVASAAKAVEVAVSDTGLGISPVSLPHVFDRFWQADNTSPAGSGLGLAIAKAIVEAHGGQISVESVEGQGSIFRFTIPEAS